MISRLTLAVWITIVTLVGVAAQTGAYLLEFSTTSPASPVAGDDRLDYARRGGHPVGVRRFGVDEAPMPVMVWYPTVEHDDRVRPVAYSLAVGVFGVGTATALATDRGRAEPGAVFDESQGPYPLVVLSHGFGMTAGSYAWLAEHLASQGLVVLAPQHPETLDPTGLWRSTVDRPHLVRSILSWIDGATRAGGAFDGLIDGDSIAVIGHSYGGYTALASAGARIDSGAFDNTCAEASAADQLAFLCDAVQSRLGDAAERAGLRSRPAGLWPDWSDPRIDAIVVLAGDAAMFGEDGLAEVTVPMLAIGGTADTDSPFEWGTRYAYDHVSSRRKVEVALEGAAHFVFAADCAGVRRIERLVALGFCTDPAWDRSLAHSVVSHYVSAFLRAELGGDVVAGTALASDSVRVPDVGYRAEGY